MKFYIGQPVDEVVKIATATRTARRAVEFTGEEGTFRFDEDMKREDLNGTVDLSQDLTVRYFYDDYILTFERTRPEGGGASCYRVVKIECVQKQ